MDLKLHWLRGKIVRCRGDKHIGAEGGSLRPFHTSEKALPSTHHCLSIFLQYFHYSGYTKS